MIKKIIFSFLFFFLFLSNGFAQKQGIFFSLNYDSLASVSRPFSSKTQLKWLNSSVGFTLGGFYNKKLNDRFILSSKAIYQLRGFRKIADNGFANLHYVGVDETVQFRWNKQSKFHLLLGVGAAYRIPVNFRKMTDLNRFDVHANLGVKYEIGKFGVVVQFSPSFTEVFGFDFGNNKSVGLQFRTIQLGVEIPLK